MLSVAETIALGRSGGQAIVAGCAVCLAFASSHSVAEVCITKQEVLQLDANYERAIGAADVKTLSSVLHPQFRWVHNLASAEETYDSLIERVSRDSYEKPIKRQPQTQSVIKEGDTWVLLGVNTLHKYRPTESNPNNIRAYEYYFSRTYVQSTGELECRLLSSMTMKLSEKDLGG